VAARSRHRGVYGLVRARLQAARPAGSLPQEPFRRTARRRPRPRDAGSRL